MAIIRTAKGTASDKTGALTLTIATLQVAQYSTLEVCIAFDQGNGKPNSMKWGTRELVFKDVQQANGVGLAVYTMFRNNATATNDLVATWNTTAPTAKVMFATQVSGVRKRDLLITNSNANSTTPTTGALQLTGFADEYLAGCMASEGPSTDTIGTPSLSYLLGQRVGTTGGADDSNITLQEIYKITSAAESTRARMTGVEARDWSNILITFAPIYNVSVDNRVEVQDVEAATQLDADALIENDILSRYPPNYTVTILP